jgi:rubrerythrin
MPSRAIQPVARPVCGRIRPPGSRSLTNRALVVAALADGTSDLEALKIAIDFEQRAVRLYEKAAADSGNPTSQSFYRELAKWEGTHYRILDNSYDYLANKGEWYFQELEMPMYEG